ncbi:guanylate kinase [Wenzhouxiangella sp. XN24]|uniref:guanylate kinase n=1 Tax=Wenzhouxiangella sp. XN24 TaxID=2713569 RepID=UPI0013EA3C8E|nr:guanylate kinase [Wenzhouxiangella sp. XN24]NGX17454.1 guanylate kinase [Wenzhouxiangella sp. XN24]
MNAQNRLFVISAPSGAGKTSLVRELMAREPGLRFSISYTTRPQRNGEVDGEDYFFVSQASFRSMIAAGAFLEHARVFDHFYGTSRAQVESLLGEGYGVVLEIDWQGARQVRAAMPDSVGIFILPPSRAELERRLRSRGTDSEDVIRRRLADAATDISHWSEFRYAVVNDEFPAALQALLDIVGGKGEASRADRPELAPLAEALQA